MEVFCLVREKSIRGKRRYQKGILLNKMKEQNVLIPGMSLRVHLKREQ